MYDYRKAMYYDVENAIRENFPKYWDCDIREELEEKANDELWINDRVTGNASGSYTFNSYKAAENLAGNYDLVRALIDEFGIDAQTVAKNIDNPEYWDVSIRCYLLDEIIAEVLDNLEDELFPEETEEE